MTKKERRGEARERGRMQSGWGRVSLDVKSSQISGLKNRSMLSEFFSLT